MAYVTPTTVLTNDLIAAGDWNKNTVDNPIALRTGEIALTSQAVGDLVIATSATQLGRVADVAVGQVLVSGGVTTAPAYSASPSITALTYTTSLKSTTALATPGALSATQATAFASTVSGAAIMGFGTTNDVSLMNRAGTVVLGVGPNTTAVNMTGLLTVSGFGTHTFSGGSGSNGQNNLNVSNVLAGTSAFASLQVYANSGGGSLDIYSFSTTYTTSGPYVQSASTIAAGSTGGLSIAATHASGAIRFYSGGTTLRLTIPSDSAGVQFPATQAASTNANTLDDYEEGTWTPVIGGDGGTSGQVYEIQSGHYIKIGQLVVLDFYAKLSTKGTITGDVTITGLPFTTVAAISNGDVGASFLTWGNLATSFVSIAVALNGNSTTGTVKGATAAATVLTALTAAALNNNSVFGGTITYRASA